MPAFTYFTPRYFATSYFHGLQPSHEVPLRPQVSDLEVYEAIVAALNSTRLFPRVSFPSPGHQSPMVSPDQAWVMVSPLGWHETSDPGGNLLLRELRFTVILSLNPSDKRDAFDRLVGLGNIVQDLIDASSLGGLVLSDKTRLSRGQWEFGVRGFSTQLTLNGTVAYVVDRRQGRSPSWN